jgi:hypothetical protein
MASPDLVLYCSACGKPHTFYLSQVSPQHLHQENQQLREEKLYLNHVCEDLNERLAVAESMAAWADADGTAIANLI